MHLKEKEHVPDPGSAQPKGGFSTLKSTGGGFVLANSEDEVLVISATGQTLDTVRYAGPSVPTGAALGLRPSIQDPGANDLSGNWCAQVSRLSSGDAGTPGADNDSC